MIDFTNKYVLDLETTTDISYANVLSRVELMSDEKATFICAMMYAPIAKTCDNVIQFYGKDNAENGILDLPAGTYYTWNGARFDSHFMYHLLRKGGYEKKVKLTNNSSKKNQLRKYEYTYLLSGSRFISLSFKNENGLVEIKDACLLFTCSLASFIKNTCPEEELQKLVGTYDYKKFRIKEVDFSEQDKEYCRADIRGFAIGMYRIVNNFEQEFDGMNILDSLTAGSFAMKFAKTQLGDEAIKKYFPKVFIPREFVAGGRTYVNPNHVGKIFEKVTKIDVNSFYPSIMVQAKLPYGAPLKVKVESDKLNAYLEKYPNRYVFAKLIKGVVVYDGMFSPITTYDDNAHVREYPTHATHEENVYLDDNILRDKRFRHKGQFMLYIFHCETGIFNYMNKVYHLKNQFKKEKKKALELAVKIILNSTYGKFIQRDEVKEYDFFDGTIEPTGEKREMNGWYLYSPIGAAITAKARHEITRCMNLLGDRFIYCDTDSLIFTGETPKSINLGSKLGEWDEEATPTGLTQEGKKTTQSGKFVAFQRKTYAMEEDGVTHITFCGISDKAIERKFPKGISVEELKKQMEEGISFSVLQGNKTKSGVVLIERERMKQYIDATAFSAIMEEQNISNADILIKRAESKKYVERY